MEINFVEESFMEWEKEDAKKLDVGTRIGVILISKGMTQRELAQKCHITEVSMSRYINNSRMPKGNVLMDIAKALNVSADYLLGLTSLKNKDELSCGGEIVRNNRESIYITLCVILSTALSELADYDFRTLLASLRKYMDELEKECDNGQEHNAD